VDITTIFTTLITAVSSVTVALITAGYFRKWQDKTKEKHSRNQLMAQIQKDELVHFTLREIRRQYDADRVYIAQFHNGGTFYTNSPMQKSSVTYERNSDGLERIADRFQNVLVSHHTWYLTETMSNRMFYIDIDEKMSDLPTKSLLKNFGNYAHAAVPIYDNEKRMVAIMSLSWVFSEIPANILEGESFSDEFKSEFYQDANSLKSYII